MIQVGIEPIKGRGLGKSKGYKTCLAAHNLKGISGDVVLCMGNHECSFRRTADRTNGCVSFAVPIHTVLVDDHGAPFGKWRVYSHPTNLAINPKHLIGLSKYESTFPESSETEQNFRQTTD